MADHQADHGSGLTRRQVLVAGAWTAPVIVLAQAAPARAASGDGNVPASFLTVSSFDLSNLNENGLGLGPLQYAGGQIG
ncbi:hypothetical protein ACC691_36015, partial [Rhizobium johnstonii]|uniref:hypothetical protein n=1 Tax=Rhizobium johnstonii TaxID=3019933 RepID=UPI003F9C8A13